MLKRFSHCIACLLLVLMPLQAMAVANMMVCSNMTQSNVTDQSVAMPCHQVMTNNVDKLDTEHGQYSNCGARCASLCANICGITAIIVNVQSGFAFNSIYNVDFNHKIYVSINQASLQRPPISFI